MLDELNSRIPKFKIIYCNSIIKSIDYSNVKITKNDIIIAQNDNFCPSISNKININKCFKGILFPDFISEGGSCCYLELNTIDKKEKYKQCIPLSKFSRINKYFINSIIDKYQISKEFKALLICNELSIEYNSLTDKWITIT